MFSVGRSMPLSRVVRSLRSSCCARVFGAAHGDVLAPPPAEGIASEVDGELSRAGSALEDGALNVLSSMIRE